MHFINFSIFVNHKIFFLGRNVIMTIQLKSPAKQEMSNPVAKSDDTCT